MSIRDIKSPDASDSDDLPNDIAWSPEDGEHGPDVHAASIALKRALPSRVASRLRRGAPTCLIVLVPSPPRRSSSARPRRGARQGAPHPGAADAPATDLLGTDAVLRAAVAADLDRLYEQREAAMTDADLLDDLLARIVLLRERAGSAVYRRALVAAKAAVGRIVLAEAERQAGVERRSSGAVVRFPIGANARPENGGR